MSIQAVAWAIRQRVGSPTGKVLLLCLANYADENGECWPSQTTISNEAELGERATRDWLKTLEDQGFIERRRRNRADGSRTSDLLRLCLEKLPENPSSNLPAKSVGRPNQPANGSKPTGISRRSYRQDVPGNEPAKEPSENPTMGAQAPDDGFPTLWDEWPKEELPERREVAEQHFRRLSPEERLRAMQLTAIFRARQRAMGCVGRMIPYLKGSAFRELDGAPPIDRDGDFVITPEREEWKPWLEAIRAEHGEAAAASTIRHGLVVRPTRWPGGKSQNGLA